MTAKTLLADLRARGIELRVEGDTLRYRCTGGPLSPEDVAAMCVNKAALLALLHSVCVPPDEVMAGRIIDLLEQSGERSSTALARELGMSYDRRHPEGYVSVEEVAARLVNEGRLLGRVHEGAWLLRLPGGVA